MKESVSLKLFPPEKCQWLNWETGDVPPPHIQSVECLQDENLGFDGGDDDDEFCASLGSSIYPAPLCLTYRHRT